MGDVELEAPDLDVDEEASRFRRLVAVAVVLITLFGAIIAYAQAVESNDEDIAARDAQREAIEGLGDQVDSSAALAADLRIGSSVDAVIQRQALAAAQVAAIDGDADTDVALAARERLAAVGAAVADLTPIDPADGTTVSADIAEENTRPDRARLRQSVDADGANDHGGKADTYVAILTVLAVALFLLGLSLTVEGRSRFVLVVPGLAIALVCVGWAVTVYDGKVTRVSVSAIANAAEGQRLQTTGDLAGAIREYTQAIVDSPDFAAAYARRASARFLQGSPQSGQTAFLSITSDAALEDALDDLDAALARGANTDVITVSDAGFFRFLNGDYEQSIDLTSDAIALNSSLAQLYFNLGVAHVALGERADAVDAYEEGFDALREFEPSLGRRSQILAGARTDLSIARDHLRQDDDLSNDDLDDAIGLAEDMEARLAEVEMGESTCGGGEPCDIRIDASDASVGDTTFTREGASVFAQITVDGLDEGDDVGVAWYFRADPTFPFEQAALSFQTLDLTDGTAFASTLPVVQPACPVVGEYLVRVYAGGAFIGDAAAAVGGEVVELDPDEIEVSSGDSDGEASAVPNGPGGATPLGSTFTGFADPVEGFEACIPDGFTVAQQDVSELDAFTSYGSPESGVIVGVNVTPGGFTQGDDPEAQQEAILTQFVPGADIFSLDLIARDINGDFVRLTGSAAIGVVDGFGVSAVIASGPDSSNRIILVTSDVDDPGFENGALLREAAGTVTFTGVDTSGG